VAPAEVAGGHQGGEAEKDRHKTIDPSDAHESGQTRLARAREHDEPSGAEADGLRGDERLEQAEQLAGEDRGSRHRLRVQQLGRSPIRRQLEDAEHERRQRYQQQDELHERHGRARNVRTPPPERMSRTGDEQGRPEHHREDLQPAGEGWRHQLVHA
jgi:hypothetical protein